MVLQVLVVKVGSLLNPPFLVHAKGKLVECSFVRGVVFEGLQQDAYGLFPLPEVLVLQRHVDVDVLAQFCIGKRQQRIEMLKRQNLCSRIWL